MKPPKDFQLRAAKQEDQSVIWGLIRRVRINPLNLDWHNFIVAIGEHGEIIGCGQIKVHRDGTNELASIAVEQEWRGKGIATKIIQSLLKEASLPIWLVCRAELESFYKRFGFQVIDDVDSLPKAYRRIRRVSRLFSRMLPSIREIRIMHLESST